MKLNFLKRVLTYFYNESFLRVLYNSLIRSKLKCASLICHSDSILQTQSLYSVQNNFLEFLWYKCRFQIPSHSEYDYKSRFLGLFL